MSGKFKPRLIPFGKLLARYRLMAGLSQTALAVRVGVTQSAISSWELGENDPGVEMVQAIESVLGLRPGQLSVALGWLPARTRRQRCGYEEATLADSALSDADKDLLLQLYARLVG